MIKKVFLGITVEQDVRKYIEDKHKETLVSRSVIVNELLKKAIKNEK